MDEEKVYCSMYSRNAELYHHGIKGQKWGVQNGPPYPLDSGVSTGKKIKKIGKYDSENAEYFKKIKEEEKLLKDNQESIYKYGDYDYKYESEKLPKLKYISADRSDGDAIWNKKRTDYHYNSVSAEKSLEMRENEKKILDSLSDKKIISELAEQVYAPYSYNGKTYRGEDWVKEWAGRDVSKDEFKKSINSEVIHFAYYKEKPFIEIYTNNVPMFGYHTFVMEYDPESGKFERYSFEG